MSLLSIGTRALADANLKTKLTILTMFACTLTAFLLSSAFVLSDIINIRQQLVQEITLTGKIIGERTSSRIAFQQAETARKDLLALEYKPSVIGACIYLNDKTLFADYSARDTDYQCPDFSPLGYYFTPETLTVHQTIKTPIGVENGSIYILSDLREIYERIEKSLITVLLIVLAVMVLAYFVVEKLQKVVTAPVFSLVETTRDVGQGRKYTARAKKYYNDEIGELTDSFNKMMVQIQDANENLERKVLKRTRALEKEKIKAESANRAKSEFLRNMSHEFRTPLHAMNSFSIYGIKEAETADRKDLHKYFTRIQNGTTRLLKLIDGVLSLARLESGQEAFTIEKGNLYNTAKTVLKEEQSLLQDKNITVKMPRPECSTIAAFDNDKMVQVVTNILSNAIKFTPEGKKIFISFSDSTLPEEKGGKDIPAICMAIADQGCGIPDDELSTIFDKFVQSSRTNTGAGGTGLGLAIAKGIINGHEGSIAAENNEDGGTTFRVIIPTNLPEGQKIVTVTQGVQGTNKET